MMRSGVWAIGALSLAACSACAQDLATDAERDGWELVWSDEFDGPTLDEKKWRVEDAALVKNKELQYYDPSEVYIEDGCLVLRSQKRTLGGREYTSGLVDTQERFSQAFGRFEVRARLPKGQGVWPAHWMLPDDHPAWPPEIDIMELLGHEPDTVHMTQHWGTWPENAYHGVPFQGPDFSEGFHVFAVEWSPDRIDWYIDDVLRHSSTNDVPRIPFYLILNTAVGGEWPGNPDETTVFPQHHRIDYVRVYRREVPGRTVLTTKSANGRIDVVPPQYDFHPTDTPTLTAVPDFGYVFDRWSGRGVYSSEPTVSVSMTQSRSVEARFRPDPAIGERLRFVGAAASSSEGDGLEADNAIDFKPGTRWASAFSDPQTLTLDLGVEKNLRVVRLIWQHAHAARYSVEVSVDGDVWSEVAVREKSDPSADVIPVDRSAKYLRITSVERATRWGCSLWEVEAYGAD